MNEPITNTASCVASIANGPNGKVALICGTVVILYGITAACYLISNGHTVTVTCSSTKLEAA